jgi:glycosyltransferase involved in cell wall biosynthesis
MTNKVIVLSPNWKQVFAKLLREDKISVVHNFVNLSAFSNSNSENRSSNNVSGMVKVLFVGGSGAKGKGLYDVVEVIALVTENNIKIKYGTYGGSD